MGEIWATVTVETGWDPPTERARRRGWLDAIVQLLGAVTGDAARPSMVGSPTEPKWRLVVQDATGTRWAESAWRQEWFEVERLQAQWQAQLTNMPESEARATLGKWSGT